MILYLVTWWPKYGKPVIKVYGRKNTASGVYTRRARDSYNKRVTLDEVHVSAADFKRLKESGEA